MVLLVAYFAHRLNKFILFCTFYISFKLLLHFSIFCCCVCCYFIGELCCVNECKLYNVTVAHDTEERGYLFTRGRVPAYSNLHRLLPGCIILRKTFI